MRLLFDVAQGLWESIREAFPSTEDEAGPWLGGFCVSFCLHWVMLILVTLAWFWGHR